MLIMDLDGVFADFTSAACAVHDKYATNTSKWNFFLDWKITVDQFWDKIHAEGDNFYGEMVLPYPWAKELLLEVQKTDEYIIMTSPSSNPYGYSGKKIWIDKYLQPLVLDPIRLVVGSEKHLLANPNICLVDDYDENIKSFHEAGGFTVTFPQLWNSNRVYAGTGLHYTKRQLKLWKEKQLNAQKQQKRSKLFEGH